MEMMSKQNGQKIHLSAKSSAPETDAARQHIVATVRRWGGASSAAVLDTGTQTFTVPGIEGLIGYRLEHQCAIVFGDPVCRLDDRKSLVQAFHEFCGKNAYHIIYITTTEGFARWAIDNNMCKALIESGEEMTYDPHHDPRDHEGVRGSLVRRKVRHALQEGLLVEEYASHDPSLEAAIEEVGETWLKSRQGPQVYISHHHLFTDRLGKRWFYATHHNRVVGVVQLNQLQAQEGWLLNHVMHTPDAPHGTPELLVVRALEAIRQEGCRHVTFGTVPRAKIGEIIGLGLFSQAVSRVFYQIFTKIFRLTGRKKFWEKFEPQSSGSYLLFSHPRIGLKEIRALMKALNVSFN